MPDSERILLVDDDERILRLLERFLAEHGFEIICAADAASALAAAEKSLPATVSALPASAVVWALAASTSALTKASGSLWVSASCASPSDPRESATLPDTTNTRSPGLTGAWIHCSGSDRAETSRNVCGPPRAPAGVARFRRYSR